VNDFSKTNSPYDITDLLKLTAKDFQHLDVRVTVTAGRGGDRVVVFSTKTGRDVSVALNDFEAEALGRRLATAFPQEKCNLHRPYRQGRRNRWDFMSDCACAVVFQSRLLARRVEASVNVLHQATNANRQTVAEVRAQLGDSEERWPGVQQDSLFAGDKVE
jgi:hypothetical protein